MSQAAQSAPESFSDLAGAWTLDPARTTVRFRTKAMWVLNVNGTLRATEGSGTVDSTGTATGRLTLDAASIDTHNKKRDEHLRSADFFDVSKHPTLVFDLTGARLGPAGEATVSGDLSIHGVSRPIELTAHVRLEGDGAVAVSAQTEIDRSEWDMRWAKMGAGLHNVIDVNATFVRSTPPASPS